MGNLRWNYGLGWQSFQAFRKFHIILRFFITIFYLFLHKVWYNLSRRLLLNSGSSDNMEEEQ